MDYSKIISVTGLSGLYELVTSKADGAVVRSLEDKSTKFVSSRLHNFSHLESIEVYTTTDNTVLAELFKSIKESAEPLPDVKADGKALKSYFEKVYPDLDFDRVYASDMKKIIKWYQILTDNNIEIKQGKEEGDEENKSEEVEQPIAEAKGETKTKSKKKAKGESVIEEIKNETPVPEDGSLKNNK